MASSFKMNGYLLPIINRTSATLPPLSPSSLITSNSKNYIQSILAILHTGNMLVGNIKDLNAVTWAVVAATTGKPPCTVTPPLDPIHSSAI